MGQLLPGEAASVARAAAAAWATGAATTEAAPATAAALTEVWATMGAPRAVALAPRSPAAWAVAQQVVPVTWERVPAALGGTPA